jgi:hypothetical protein
MGRAENVLDRGSGEPLRREPLTRARAVEAREREDDGRAQRVDAVRDELAPRAVAPSGSGVASEPQFDMRRMPSASCSVGARSARASQYGMCVRSDAPSMFTARSATYFAQCP